MELLIWQMLLIFFGSLNFSKTPVVARCLWEDFYQLLHTIHLVYLSDFSKQLCEDGSVRDIGFECSACRSSNYQEHSNHSKEGALFLFMLSLDVVIQCMYFIYFLFTKMFEL